MRIVILDDNNKYLSDKEGSEGFNQACQQEHTTNGSRMLREFTGSGVMLFPRSVLSIGGEDTISEGKVVIDPGGFIFDVYKQHFTKESPEVFVSHGHGDHVLGLPTLQSMSEVQRIFGPCGLEDGPDSEMSRGIITLSQNALNLSNIVGDVKPVVVYEFNDTGRGKTVQFQKKGVTYRPNKPRGQASIVITDNVFEVYQNPSYSVFALMVKDHGSSHENVLAYKFVESVLKLGSSQSDASTQKAAASIMRTVLQRSSEKVRDRQDLYDCSKDLLENKVKAGAFRCNQNDVLKYLKDTEAEWVTNIFSYVTDVYSGSNMDEIVRLCKGSDIMLFGASKFESTRPEPHLTILQAADIALKANPSGKRVTMLLQHLNGGIAGALLSYMENPYSPDMSACLMNDSDCQQLYDKMGGLLARLAANCISMDIARKGACYVVNNTLTR